VRIAIAHHEYSRFGGIERHLVELAEGLAALGHEVEFFGVVCREHPCNGVVFTRVAVPTQPNSVRMVAFELRARKVLSAARKDVTISAGSVVGTDIVVAQSCHAAGRAIPDARELRSKGRRNWGVADRIRLSMERRIFSERRYKRIVAVSRGVARELGEMYGVPPRDITVIPNGVDLEHFHPRWRESVGKGLRRALEIPATHPLILFVGHEFRRKGLEPLLEALGTLNDESWDLLVAGDDDAALYRDAARRLGIGGRVHFLGSVKDTRDVYAAADLFVFPTAYEAWPLAMLEAAASGLPLIVTRVNGAEDFVVDGRNGLFVERSPGDIAEKILMCLKNESLTRSLGEGARSSSMTYGWDRITRSVEQVVNDIAIHGSRQ